jgi:hypothetical protein|tara:strand:+ start:4662 stop:5381 length:720 start_codon:yes stop_codon:yes gene_type:complete
MKKIILSIAMIFSLGLIADDHTEPNYSKFQANYFFSCPNEPACGAAFDKMMNSPDIKEQKYEAALSRISLQGYTNITHSINFYYKSAERFQEASEVFSSSSAFAVFGQEMAAAGAEPYYHNLTSYLIAEGDGRGANYGVTFVSEVSDPIIYFSAFKKMAAEMFEESFGGEAYVLRQQHTGGGNVTHSVSVYFNSNAEVLDFLANYQNTSQFAKFVEEAGTTFKPVRTYMEQALLQYNPD